ncbi:MAG: 30S ribosomal protein S12 methylthiotransferase RimO [Muribaculaceae bacterium]|nr:30S ribosomal protein S12 methylthiotransferase RimO [Muribaculaceae bacterium]
MPRKNGINVITMGCSKNLVDSERLLKMLRDSGFEAVHDAPLDDCHGYAAVINTCGFIGDAKEESINMILEALQARDAGLLTKVYVMGCLSERYRSELETEMPEVDGWYGKFDWHAIVRDLAKAFPATAPWDRVLTTPSHHAYLKIAEGCNRFCAFCAIPLITGRYKSRPEEEILEEVRQLTARGVKEFNIIAQDLSAYGSDLPGGGLRLASLIDRMAGIDGVRWIRLHYAYPAQFPYEILPVMAKHENVCKYLDIALQHIADPVLSNMRRHITSAETEELLARIRREVPGIHIRTTLMVGFPGEGEAEFDSLLDFVRRQRFERMGAFAYCEEDDTYAAKNFSDDIPQDVKQQRLDKLMKLQEEISMEVQQSKIGTIQRVVIDSENDDYYIGRTQFDSPEVDPEVLIEKTAEMRRGEFYDVEIIDALPFELIARPCQ